MSRESRVDVCTLNIRVHTRHHPDEYTELWKMLFRLRAHVVRGHTGLMIGEAMSVTPGTSRSLIRGYFYKFLEIDRDEPWFDIESGEQAGQEDMSRIVIPDKLRPNLVEIPYVFDPVKHHLHFVARGGKTAISPMMVQRLIKGLAGTHKVQNRFESIDVTIVTDTADIDRLLALHALQSLEIVIDRPNPAERDDDETFYDRMRRRGVSREAHAYKKAPREQSIQPDEEMRDLAHVAAENGVVKVVGRDERNIRVAASSAEFPRRREFKYSKSQQTMLDALIAFILR